MAASTIPKYKILAVGAGGSGKTSLLLRLTENQFEQSWLATIGIDYRTKLLELPGLEKSVVLQIWDTAGQERFRTITLAYYRGSNGIMIVYDTDDMESFRQVENWAGEVTRNASEDVAIVLIANKCDIPAGQRAVSTEQGCALASKLGVKFFETSAKTGLGVQEAFCCLAMEINKKRLQKPLREPCVTGIIRHSPKDVEESNDSCWSNCFRWNRQHEKLRD